MTKICPIVNRHWLLVGHVYEINNFHTTNSPRISDGVMYTFIMHSKGKSRLLMFKAMLNFTWQASIHSKENGNPFPSDFLSGIGSHFHTQLFCIASVHLNVNWQLKTQLKCESVQVRNYLCFGTEPRRTCHHLMEGWQAWHGWKNSLVHFSVPLQVQSMNEMVPISKP